MRFKGKLGGCGCFVMSLIFLVVGGGMIFGSTMANNEASRIERLPVVSGVLLADSPVGREVVIEGFISSNMPSRYSNLVAYERQYHETYYSQGKRRTRWVTDVTVTPPLVINTSSGRVQLEASSSVSAYSFDHAPATINEGDHRYNGFRVNDPVMAFGTVQRGSEGLVLDAQLIHGGTRQTYVDGQRTVATIFFWIGIAMIGISIGAIAIVVLRRLVGG